jgi:hypothetical protein
VTIFVEEYTGMAPSGRPERFQVVPQLVSTSQAVTQVSSGGAVTAISLAANTQFVALMGTANGFYIFGASSTGSTAAGSTYFIPPNTQILRGVKPLAKLFVWST